MVKGFIIRPIGTIYLSLESRLRRVNAQFKVVSGERTRLLGLKSCINLGRLRRVKAVQTPNFSEFVKQNKNFISGLDCFICKLKIPKDVAHMAHQARMVPFKTKQ